jgi:hypothetical protein
MVVEVAAADSHIRRVHVRLMVVVLVAVQQVVTIVPGVVLRDLLVEMDLVDRQGQIVALWQMVLVLE